jgi:PAS domain S-box-containing protein
MAVSGHHDPALVVISVVIAIFAAYTALDLASRVRLGEGWPAHAWLLAAAVAMGGGIWSMHFVAMLAFSLAMPMVYDLGLTVLSLIVAIAVTGIAFLVVNRLRSRRSGIVAAGAFMGLGIVAMHYTGMEAMRMAAGIIYDPLLVALSVAIAVMASTVALWLAFRRLGVAERMVAAAAMGVAIAGMHYTGMAAASFTMHEHMASGLVLEQAKLALAVTVTTFVILSLALVAAMLDRQATLNNLHRRTTEILESISEAFYAVDDAWRFTYVNRKSEEWWRVRRAELLGKNLWDQFPQMRATPVEEALRAAARDRRPVQTETLSPVFGRWIEMQVFPAEAGLSVYFRDITDRKRAEEELWRLNETLENRVAEEIAERQRAEAALHQSQKMEAVGQLTGGVAHDFNNILTVITGNLELIAQAAQGNARIQRLVDTMQHASERAARLTAQLLAFSRRQTLHPQIVNLNELVREFQPLIARAAGEAITLELVSDLRLWSCKVDVAQFQSALLNLTLNARDAMPDGGALRIALRNVLLGPAEAEAAGIASGRYVGIFVADTGCGMAPETAARAFDPFFTTKDVGKGTGLGLSMVYGFVRQSGGYVAIMSTPGEGTTVSLYLPQSEPLPAVDAEPAAPPLLAARGAETVLVVEDDEGVLQATSEALAAYGYRVLSARNGIEAMRVLEAGNIDLLLSDVVMPQGLNGVELARRARGIAGDIKVLLTSGYAGDVLARLDAENEFPILGKPFRQAELVARIGAILRESA